MESAPSSDAKNTKKAKDFFGQALPSTSSLGTQTMALVPKECKEFWDYLLSQTNKQLSNLLETKQLRWEEACLKIKEPSLTQAKNVLELCVENLSEKECALALNMYRAQVIAYTYAAEKDLSKLDSSVLMNMIIAKFANGNFEAEDFKSLKDYSKELLKKEPGLYAAEKSLAGALFLESMSRDPKNMSLNEEMLAALEACRKSNPNDIEIWELSIVPELMKENLQAALDLAVEVEKAKPELGLHHYYRAAVLWKQKDRSGAISELQWALGKEPSNDRYKGTLEKVKVMKTGESGAFNLNLNLGFDDT